VDASGRITDFNQAAEELIGVSADDARGRVADQVIHLVSDDGDDLGARLRKPLPRRWSVLGGVRQPDGDLIPVALSAGALRGPGAEVVGGVFVLRDLTREREVERMKDEFLSRASHELRTPLTPVIGYIELLLNRDVAPRNAKEMYREILDNTDKLMRIIKIIELVTRDTAGRMSIRQEHVNMRSIVDDVVAQWSDRVDGKHSIARRVSRQLPIVDADATLLSEALHELIDNAVKFSPDGGRITVTVFPAEANGSGSGVEISVTDQGKGMSPEERQRAFDDFFQGDASDTRSFGGLGLGLSLVKRVAEAHGGSVASESRAGKGSKLSIFLPAAPKTRRRK
jgi:PAS domain S-box-containing protein